LRTNNSVINTKDMDDFLKLIDKESNTNSNLKIVSRDGDRKLSFWYSQYFNELLFISFHLLGSESEAEDVVSGIFEKLIRIYPNNEASSLFTNDDELVGYLKISVRNACYDVLRARKRRGGILNQIGLTLKFWKRPETFDKFQNEAFELMMMQLSERENQILQLHLKGYKNEEIAEMLSLSQLTVRNTLHNAKKRIRKIWNTFMR
jgi:RNA polymerase sigma factor (sigma-70 family)